MPSLEKDKEHKFPF